MGQSPVQLSCLMNDINSLRILLRCSAETNTIDRLGISPLAHCISNGKLQQLNCGNTYYRLNFVYIVTFQLQGMEEFAHLLIDGNAKENLANISLHRLKDSFKQALFMRLKNPPTLKDIARKSIGLHFGPHVEDWIVTNQTELPRSLVPFLLFNRSDL